MAGKDIKALTESLQRKIKEIELRQKERKIVKKPPKITVIPTEHIEQKAISNDSLPSNAKNDNVFVCNLLDCSIKDDIASMEVPIYSLSTREDTREWKWISEDGSRSVSVVPIAKWGRATQFDKDILIFCTSQLTAALNNGHTISKTIRFTAYNLLKATDRSTSGVGYDRLKDALNRLSGTRISTEIKTGGQRISEGFGLIDYWKVIEKSTKNDKMIAIEVRISDWLMNSISSHEVLTVSPDYFKIRKPLERKLYEIARKHVGQQQYFTINLEVLMKKAGVMDALRNFRAKMKTISKNNPIPAYKFSLSDDDMITIIPLK